jgi:tetratricopeptide (TPR) repeat protein
MARQFPEGARSRRRLDRMSDLKGTLELLSSASLVRRVLTESGAEFKFRHTLDRETAYRSMLRRDREKIHKVVGETLESHPATQIEALAPVLAEHFSIGGDDRRAIKYFMLAGDEAARVYAHEEALDYYQSALTIGQENDVDRNTLCDLYLRQGRTLELSGEYPAAMETYQELEALGKRRGDVALELAALTRQATLLVAPSAVSDYEAGAALANRLLDLAVDAGDKEAQARAHWSLLLSRIYGGELQRGIVAGEKGLVLAKELGLEELQAYITNDLSGPYLMAGRLDRAWELLEEAIEIWRRLDNLPMLVDSLGNMNSGLIFKGLYDEALENSRQARQIADRIDNRWAKAFSLFMIELIHAERGDFDKAFATCADQIYWGRQAGFRIPEVYSNASQAWNYAYLGDFDRAEACLSEASTAAPRLGDMWTLLPSCIELLVNVKQHDVPDPETVSVFESLEPGAIAALTSSPVGPYWQLAICENDLGQGRYQQALERFSQAGALESESRIHVLAVDLFELLARIHRAMGDSQAAYEALDRGQAEAEFVNSRRMLWVVHAERALWLEADGQPEIAATERLKARPSFDYILNHVADESLRDSFVNAAWVRRLGMT